MGKFKFKITKKKIVAASGVVVLLIAALGAGFLVWWLQHKDIASSSVPPVAPFDEFKERGSTKAAQEVKKLAFNDGKVDAANAKIQEDLKNPSISTDEKYQLMSLWGLNYANAGDHQKALEIYLETEKVKSDFTISHLIGEEYEALGNKTKAVEYFKKAISQLNTSSVGYQSDKDHYEAKIKELGGQL